MEQAYQRLIEFSVIGAAFVALFVFSSSLVWWILRRSAEMIREKDGMLAETNEQRAEAAGEAIRAITIQNERMRRVLDMLEELIGRGHHDSEDH